MGPKTIHKSRKATGLGRRLQDEWDATFSDNGVHFSVVTHTPDLVTLT